MALPQPTLTPGPPMSISVSQLHPALHELFHAAADRLAAQTGFCRRRRQLTGSAFAKAVVFSLLENPASSLQDLADFASEHLGVDVSHNAFEQRLGPRAAGFLAALLADALGRCLRARPALLPVLRRFNGVYLRDASAVGLPAHLAGLFPGRKGKGGRPSAALKLVLEL